MEDESCASERRNKRSDGEKKMVGRGKREKGREGERRKKRKIGKENGGNGRKKGTGGVYTEGLAKKSIESRNRGKT